MITVSSGSHFDDNGKALKGGVNGVLCSVVHDSTLEQLVMMDFVGPRAVVKGIVANCQKKQSRGKNGVGAMLFDGSQHFMTVRLAEKTSYYQTFSVLRTGAMQGRLTHFNATANAERQECYVLVPGEIKIEMTRPTWNVEQVVTQSAQDEWSTYCEWIKQPVMQRGEHQSPRWCVSLYQMFLFLSERVNIGVFPQWMPYLFNKLANKSQLSEDAKGYVTPIRYVDGTIGDPLAEMAIGKNIIRGAYHMDFRATDLWRKAITENPNRADGINFVAGA